jgi:hypothetical protein
MNRTNKKLINRIFLSIMSLAFITTATGQTKTINKFYLQGSAGGVLMKALPTTLACRPLLKINGVPHYPTRN